MAKTNFFNFINARTVLHEPGHCVQQVDIKPEFLQMLGVVHGGLIAALVDDAIGEAMNAMLDLSQEIALTSQLQITYLSSCCDGRLTVEARILNRGRTTGYGEAIVSRKSPEGEKVLARGNALLIRKKRRSDNPLPDELAREWKDRSIGPESDAN
ncbi:PaaI family thioesterase [bacterium]|nr:PaaI family thioesterase [bacterium]